MTVNSSPNDPPTVGAACLTQRCDNHNTGVILKVGVCTLMRKALFESKDWLRTGISHLSLGFEAKVKSV